MTDGFFVVEAPPQGLEGLRGATVCRFPVVYNPIARVQHAAGYVTVHTFAEAIAVAVQNSLLGDLAGLSVLASFTGFSVDTDPFFSHGFSLHVGTHKILVL